MILVVLFFLSSFRREALAVASSERLRAPCVEGRVVFVLLPKRHCGALRGRVADVQQA